MTVKDITPTEDDLGALLAFGVTLEEDIHKRWPVWLEMAKANPTKMSSPYMVVATQLMGQGIMAMLCAQVAPADVIKQAEGMIDILCNPEFHKNLDSLGEDKKEIMTFVERIVMDNVAHLASQGKVN